MQALLRPTLRSFGCAKQLRFASAAAAATEAAPSMSQASITNIEKRWEKLPEVDRKFVITSLSQRQKLPWDTLTTNEKKAAYYISFGEWGPRQPLYSKQETRTIFWGTTLLVGLSIALYLGYRSLRRIPVTMSREWQEKEDEILKERKSNPFHGYSQVQSK